MDNSKWNDGSQVIIDRYKTYMENGGIAHYFAANAKKPVMSNVGESLESFIERCGISNYVGRIETNMWTGELEYVISDCKGGSIII